MGEDGEDDDEDEDDNDREDAAAPPAAVPSPVPMPPVAALEEIVIEEEDPVEMSPEHEGHVAHEVDLADVEPELP
jgi:hypothetical protein